MAYPLLPLLFGNSLVTAFVAERNLAQQRGLAELTREQTLLIEAERQKFQERTQVLSHEFQEQQALVRFERDRAMQEALAWFNRDTQSLIAQFQRETALSQIETQHAFTQWPLNPLPPQILQTYRGAASPSLTVIINPPRAAAQAPFLPGLEGRVVRGLRPFLQHHYPPADRQRPVRLLDGAWKRSEARAEIGGQASVQILHSMLSSIPVLVLELTAVDGVLDLSVGYWAAGQQNYFYGMVFRFPYDQIFQEYAERQALAWRDERERHLRAGLSGEEVAEMDVTSEANLAILARQEKLAAAGAGRRLRYKSHPQDVAHVDRVLADVLKFTVGWFADSHYMLHAGPLAAAPPRMPHLLKEVFAEDTVTQGMLHPLANEFVGMYRPLLDALRIEQSHHVPGVALRIAEDLAQMPDDRWAKEYVEYAIAARVSALLGDKSLDDQQDRDRFGQLEAALQGTEPVFPETVDFIDRLAGCLARFGDGRAERANALAQSLRAREASAALVTIPPAPPLLLQARQKRPPPAAQAVHTRKEDPLVRHRTQPRRRDRFDMFNDAQGSGEAKDR